jgi:hypothetical protein
VALEVGHEFVGQWRAEVARNPDPAPEEAWRTHGAGRFDWHEANHRLARPLATDGNV